MTENLEKEKESDEEYEYIELKDGDDLPEGFEFVNVPEEDLQSSSQVVTGTSRKMEDILQELEKEVFPQAPESAAPAAQAMRPLSSADILASEAAKPKPEETILISGEGENFEDFSGDANDEVLVKEIQSDPDPIYMPEVDEIETAVNPEPSSELMPSLNDYHYLFDKTKKMDVFDGMSGENIRVGEKDLSGYVLLIINKISAINNKVSALNENVVRYSRTGIEEYQTFFLVDHSGSTLTFDAPSSGIIAGSGSVLYFTNVKGITIG